MRDLTRDACRAIARRLRLSQKGKMDLRPFDLDEDLREEAVALFPVKT